MQRLKLIEKLDFNIIAKRTRMFQRHIKSLYEMSIKMLPQTYIVIRLDGKNFKNFTQKYKFNKPIDQSHVNLMNNCALKLFENYKNDLLLAYGYSDEFSFAFHKETNLYNRDIRFSSLKFKIIF